MGYLQWNDSFLTGDERIDSQHKELIIRLNKLHEAMKSGRGKQEVAETIQFLESYVIHHFADEEVLAENANSPLKAANKTAHKEFIEKLKKFRQEHTSQSLTIALQVYNELSSWIINHIQTIDKKLAQPIKG